MPHGTRKDWNELSQFVRVVRLALDGRVTEPVRMACERRILREARQLAAIGFFELFTVRAAPLRTLFEDEGVMDRR